jgi:uncharacterized cupin superfamily protein
MAEKNTAVPHFNVHTATYEPAPEVNGSKKWLYESPDGARRAGSFKESGRFELVMPFDEFLYVVAGSTKVSVQGEESFDLTAGGCCFLREGLTVAFETSADYHDVCVFMSLSERASDS